MRIVQLAAGAGGMYCGSCMHDNRLAATLIEQGRDVVLVPMYTPLRTDEADASTGRVYYGGINAWLQQHSAVFRHTPQAVDRMFDAPALLRAAGRMASSTRPETLGPMTLSVVRGEHGAQRKELDKLIEGLKSLNPDIVNLPNLMFIGLARRIREELGARITCGLTGEDLFLDQLPSPYREPVFDEIRARADDVDAYTALTQYYARHATVHFGLPGERVHCLRMGVRVADFDPPADPPAEPFTIGYLARICPEKGLDELCAAFIELRRAGRACRLSVAGYLGKADRPFFDDVVKTIRAAGLGAGEVDFVGESTRAEKLRFLRTLHVLAVPTRYAESKGYFVLEALAAGAPVVLPAHGSFPELIEATGGGVLHEPGSTAGLADAIARLMDDPQRLAELARCGRAAVREHFDAGVMAEEAWGLYERTAAHVHGGVSEADKKRSGA